MTKISIASVADQTAAKLAHVRDRLTARDFASEDGRAPRRSGIGRTQMVAAGLAAMTMSISVCGAAHAASAEHHPRHVATTATGGPFEAAGSSEASVELQADQQFRSLFMTWKKLDTLEQSVIAIPSAQPVERLSFTSNYGVRSDPFRGTAAMHAGVDIPGPVGTPVYATADGYVDRAERSGGYGNLVELDHGKGIQTRYGHLSKILVAPFTRVKRGQLIALMGSTGRSTGPHLHYEVRIDGHAVNPIPFLQTADYLNNTQNGAKLTPVAMGGPANPAAD